MAREPEPTTDRPDPTRDAGLPPANDPGGAHSKGYSADPDPTAPDVPEPVPLVDAPPGGIRVPGRDDRVPPTGRGGPDDSDPNVGGDR